MILKYIIALHSAMETNVKTEPSPAKPEASSTTKQNNSPALKSEKPVG